MTTESSLKNKWQLSLRGLVLISSGILLFTVNQSYSQYLPLLFSALMLLAGILGLWFTSNNKLEHIRRGWLIMESSADIIFSIVVLYLYFQSQNIIHDFIFAFAYFSMFLSIQQIINIFRLIEIAITPNFKIIIARAVVAFAYGLFAVLLIAKGTSSESTAIINLIGIGPVSAGILVFLLCERLYIVKKN